MRTFTDGYKDDMTLYERAAVRTYERTRKRWPSWRRVYPSTIIREMLRTLEQMDRELQWAGFTGKED